MIHKTGGIVIKTVKYGETSLIATIFTELFGVQTYMVNGVRKLHAKNTKSIMLQPGAILDLEVYHSELKNLQRIKDCNWRTIYNELLSDVIKNSIATYMIELLHKILRQPEPNAELFNFCEDAFNHLDKCDAKTAANFALFFSLQLPSFLGFKIESAIEEKNVINVLYFDLKEGAFTEEKPVHTDFIEGELAYATLELLKVMHPNELDQIRLNKEIRRNLLHAYQVYYSLHLDDTFQLKSLKILQEVLGSG
jgi:DNA repair protein RecO (recombination protein O)